MIHKHLASYICLREGVFFVLKTTSKIICKLILLIGFLCITPFFSGIEEIMKNSGFLDAFVYHQHSLDESVSIKDQLNLLSYNANLTIEDDFQFQTTQDTKQTTKEPETKQETPEQPTQQEDEAKQDEPSTEAPKNKEPVDTGKKVYIYNTHQNEEYVGGQTVMDAAAILGNELEARGVHVVLETADFKAYANAQGWDYNQSYAVSYNYLNDALVNYGGFDLIIDLHRDAIPREASFLEVNGKSYAKMMPVVGGLSKNVDAITSTASTLTDIIDGKVHGIMRSTMTREAYYNQQVSDKTILIECGGDVNPFDEVKNSMVVLADGIYDYLMR